MKIRIAINIIKKIEIIKYLINSLFISFRHFSKMSFGISRNGNKAKATISKPSSSSDCDVLLSRISADREKNAGRTKELNEFVAKLQKQLEALQAQIKTANSELFFIQKNNEEMKINEGYLITWKNKLSLKEEIKEKNKKWRDYILQNNIPDDAFEFLKINGGVSCPLDSLTSDEIINIGKYTLASRIVKEKGYNDFSTYSQLYYSCCVEYDKMIVGGVHGCGSDSENELNDEERCGCHKRYARVLKKLEDIDFNTTEIAVYDRIN